MPAVHKPVQGAHWSDRCSTSANEIAAIICGHLGVYDIKITAERDTESERGGEGVFVLPKP